VCAILGHDADDAREIARFRRGTPLADLRRMSEEPTTVAADTDPVAVAGRPVEVLETMMRIHELCIERPNIVAYLGKIAPDKQEIALVHAIEVGITELIARRERFQR
jgi:hypothetical protein